jgi:hypothetical protein
MRLVKQADGGQQYPGRAPSNPCLRHSTSVAEQAHGFCSNIGQYRSANLRSKLALYAMTIRRRSLTYETYHIRPGRRVLVLFLSGYLVAEVQPC